jgi:hypothetical protein
MIRLAIPWLPPSLITVRRLSDAGQRFKNEAMAHLIRQYPTQLRELTPGRPYALVLLFHLAELETLGWPKKAKNRYKNVDVSNRVKLVEDVLVKVTDVDDSHNFLVTSAKTRGTPERIDLWVFDLTNETMVLPDELLRQLPGRVPGALPVAQPY